MILACFDAVGDQRRHMENFPSARGFPVPKWVKGCGKVKAGCECKSCVAGMRGFGATEGGEREDIELLEGRVGLGRGMGMR